MATPNFHFRFQKALLRSVYPHSQKLHKNTSVLVGTVLNSIYKLCNKIWRCFKYLYVKNKIFFSFSFLFLQYITVCGASSQKNLGRNKMNNWTTITSNSVVSLAAVFLGCHATLPPKEAAADIRTAFLSHCPCGLFAAVWTDQSC